MFYKLYIIKSNLPFIMKTKSLLILMWLVARCRTPTHDQSPPSLGKALKYMQAGELYRARKIMESYLTKNPNDLSAQKAMAEIIDREIVRHKDIFEEKVIEEFSLEEKRIEARNWLERAQMLFELKQYEEAVLAAERVFLYDPESLKASQLVDQIKNQTLLEGKREIVMRRQIAHGKLQARVLEYLKRAQEWIRSGKWGAAKLVAQKILLLEPENKEGLRLYEQIQSHQKTITEYHPTDSE